MWVTSKQMRQTEPYARTLPVPESQLEVYESLIDIKPKKGIYHKLTNEYNCIPICLVILCFLVYALGYLTGYISNYHCDDGSTLI